MAMVGVLTRIRTLNQQITRETITAMFTTYKCTRQYAHARTHARATIHAHRSERAHAPRAHCCCLKTVSLVSNKRFEQLLPPVLYAHWRLTILICAKLHVIGDARSFSLAVWPITLSSITLSPVTSWPVNVINTQPTSHVACGGGWRCTVAYGIAWMVWISRSVG